MCFGKKIISFLLSFAIIVSLLLVPASAVSDEYTSTGTFWTHVANSWMSTTLGDNIIGAVNNDVCANSPDNLHHGSLNTYKPGSDGAFAATCKDCSKTFKVYDADLEAAYRNYTDGMKGSMGSTTVGKDGWFHPTYMSGTGVQGWKNYSETVTPTYIEVSFDAKTTGGNCNLYGTFIAPATGKYRFEHSCTYVTEGISGSTSYYTGTEWEAKTDPNLNVTGSKADGYTADLTAGVRYYVCSSICFYANSSSAAYTRVRFTCPIKFLYSTDGTTVNNTYNIDSRPTTFNAPIGYYNDGGTMNVTNTTLFDESTSTYTNIVSGDTYNITNWNYDYSDRSYHCTTEEGDTVTITYGDDAIVVHDGGNVYQYQYMMPSNNPGSGGGSGGGGSDSGGGSSGIGDGIAGLLGVVGEILGGLIRGLLALATNALEALTGLGDIFAQMLTSILGFFGGFLDFLSAVFPFLPEETFVILNLGLILMIAAAVFRKFFK